MIHLVAKRFILSSSLLFEIDEQWLSDIKLILKSASSTKSTLFHCWKANKSISMDISEGCVPGQKLLNT